MISKRDVLIAIVSCFVTAGIVVSAQKAPAVMSSSVFNWETIPVKETKTGATRDFFRAAGDSWNERSDRCDAPRFDRRDLGTS